MKSIEHTNTNKPLSTKYIAAKILVGLQAFSSLKTVYKQNVVAGSYLELYQLSKLYECRKRFIYCMQVNVTAFRRMHTPARIQSILLKH